MAPRRGRAFRRLSLGIKRGHGGNTSVNHSPAHPGSRPDPEASLIRHYYIHYAADDFVSDPNLSSISALGARTKEESKGAGLFRPDPGRVVILSLRM